MTPADGSVCAQHHQLIEEHTATRVTIEGFRASIDVLDGRVLELIQVVAGSVKAGDGPGLVHSVATLIERFDDHVDEHKERKEKSSEDRRVIARRVISYVICAVIAGLSVLVWTGYKTKEIQSHETGSRSNVVRSGNSSGAQRPGSGPTP